MFWRKCCHQRFFCIKLCYRTSFLKQTVLSITISIEIGIIELVLKRNLKLLIIKIIDWVDTEKCVIEYRTQCYGKSYHRNNFPNTTFPKNFPIFCFPKNLVLSNKFSSKIGVIGKIYLENYVIEMFYLEKCLSNKFSIESYVMAHFFIWKKELSNKLLIENCVIERDYLKKLCYWTIFL